MIYLSQGLRTPHSEQSKPNARKCVGCHRLLFQGEAVTRQFARRRDKGGYITCCQVPERRLSRGLKLGSGSSLLQFRRNRGRGADILTAHACIERISPVQQEAFQELR